MRKVRRDSIHDAIRHSRSNRTTRKPQQERIDVKQQKELAENLTRSTLSKTAQTGI